MSGRCGAGIWRAQAKSGRGLPQSKTSKTLTTQARDVPARGSFECRETSGYPEAAAPAHALRSGTSRAPVGCASGNRLLSCEKQLLGINRNKSMTNSSSEIQEKFMLGW